MRSTALQASPEIDPRRVAVWGYCTGGTLAWLAACLRGDLAAAVLFFPSQPVFDELGPTTPVHPVDLLWQLTCPTLFIYGEDDFVMPPELLVDLRARIGRWDVDAQVRRYPAARHTPSPHRGARCATRTPTAPPGTTRPRPAGPHRAALSRSAPRRCSPPRCAPRSAGTGQCFSNTRR